MSDLISKKALILQALAQPGGGDLSNPEIAKLVGCDAKCVRTVKAEIETDRLRERVAELNSECGFFERRVVQLTSERDLLWEKLGEAGEKIQTMKAQLAAQEKPAVHEHPTPAKVRMKRAKDDSRPLFERGSINGVEVFVGMIQTGDI